MVRKLHRFNLALLVFSINSAAAFPTGTKLPIPELVQPARFSLVQTELQDDIQVVVFYYSASWCTPCKQTSKALRQAYPEIMTKRKGLEFITYTVDQSPRARADYLRNTQFDWPAISPEIISEDPWLTNIPGGTPQFQAFKMDNNSLIAITGPGNFKETLSNALNYMAL